MSRRLFLGVLLAVVVLTAFGGLAFWGYSAWNEAEAGVQQVRWVNVTITIPADSDIYYARLSSAPQSMARGIMGPVVALGTRGGGSLVIVDATTGEVVHGDVQPSERAAFDAVLATLEVVETEVGGEPGAPWPYGSTLPNTPRQHFENISYVDPDPASGVSVQVGMGDFIEPQPPGANQFVRVFNGRSQMHINGAGWVSITGGAELTLPEFLQADASLLQGIHPDDRAAFQRFAEAVEVGPPPTIPVAEDAAP